MYIICEELYVSYETKVAVLNSAKYNKKYMNSIAYNSKYFFHCICY